MPKFKVEFTHVEETTYTGWVEADSEKEAYRKVKYEPFEINDLDDIDNQGIEVVDIYVEEVDEQ